MWQWGFPGAPAKACPREGGDRQEASCSRIKYGTGSEEVSAQDLRDAQDKMPVGDLFEDIHAEPLPEFHHALLMARWTKACPHENGDAFVYKRMPANIHGRSLYIPDQVEDKLHTGKAVMQIAPVSGTGQAASR